VNRRSLIAGAACLLARTAAAPGEALGAAGERGATRQITDVAGRRVTLPARVARVADAWHANNSMVLALGGADKLVATTIQAQRQPWLRRLYPRIAHVPAAFNAAGDVNLETLIGARPDVVLMAYSGALPRWSAAVDAAGIPVVLMPNSSLADLETTARITGEVLGERAAKLAGEWLQEFAANIRRVTSVTGPLPRGERPRVLHTASAGVLTVDGRHTVIADWIAVAGGINAADLSGNQRPVTLEQVALWNPDVIIVGTAPNQQSREAILADPRWSQINAVRSGRVYVNPSGAYLWDRHGAEAALQVLWAARTLHPRLFADLDLKAETERFYAKYFHYRLTDDEYRSILNATVP
jgi:iron complex transport system substrate-binding protein